MGKDTKNQYKMYGLYMIFKLFKCNRTLSLVLYFNSIVVLACHGKWTAKVKKVLCQDNGRNRLQIKKENKFRESLFLNINDADNRTSFMML